MSYTYLQEQGEVSSAECFSDIPASVLSRLNLTAETSCSNDSETESCQGSQSGMMLRRSTGTRGEGASMLCAAGSRVRTSASLGPEAESKDQEADYGPRWKESSARFDPVSSSWRTAHCLLSEDLPECSVVLPKWGTMRHGELSEPTTQVFHTIEQDCGWWASPVARDHKDTPGMSRRATNPDGTTRHRVDQLARQVYASLDGSGLFSPPTVMRTETALNAELITLTVGASDQQWTNTSIAQSEVNCSEGPVSGLLNPDWVEWLMGWPIGWTDLKPLEMDTFQVWCDSHGKYSAKDEHEI